MGRPDRRTEEVLHRRASFADLVVSNAHVPFLGLRRCRCRYCPHSNLRDFHETLGSHEPWSASILGFSWACRPSSLIGHRNGRGYLSSSHRAVFPASQVPSGCNHVGAVAVAAPGLRGGFRPHPQMKSVTSATPVTPCSSTSLRSSKVMSVASMVPDVSVSTST